MRVFIVFLSLVSFLYACSGDCASCHPKILDKKGNLNKDHKRLATCKKCHDAKSMENVDMGEGGCGQDCWECHSMKKVANSSLLEHKVLNDCKNCHADKSLLNYITNSKELFKSF